MQEIFGRIFSLVGAGGEGFGRRLFGDWVIGDIPLFYIENEK